MPYITCKRVKKCKLPSVASSDQLLKAKVYFFSSFSFISFLHFPSFLHLCGSFVAAHVPSLMWNLRFLIKESFCRLLHWISSNLQFFRFFFLFSSPWSLVAPLLLLFFLLFMWNVQFLVKERSFDSSSHGSFDSSSMIEVLENSCILWYWTTCSLHIYFNLRVKLMEKIEFEVFIEQHRLCYLEVVILKLTRGFGDQQLSLVNLQWD